VKFLPFNQGNKKTQYGVMLVLALLATAFATRCAKADESYVYMGGGTTVVRGSAPAIDLAFVYPDAAPYDARLEVGATFIGASTFKGVEQRNNFAFRAAVVDSLGSFDVGIGAAYLQNTDAYNGSNLNFQLILGYRWDRLAVRWSHFSNGGTRDPNKGRDMILVSWRF
jgi:hypothetical protein